MYWFVGVDKNLFFSFDKDDAFVYDRNVTLFFDFIDTLSHFQRLSERICLVSRFISQIGRKISERDYTYYNNVVKCRTQYYRFWFGGFLWSFRKSKWVSTTRCPAMRSWIIRNPCTWSSTPILIIFYEAECQTLYVWRNTLHPSAMTREDIIYLYVLSRRRRKRYFFRSDF